MKCSNCGKEIQDKSVYCVFCGATFENKKKFGKSGIIILISAVLLVCAVILFLVLNKNEDNDSSASKTDEGSISENINQPDNSEKIQLEKELEKLIKAKKYTGESGAIAVAGKLNKYIPDITKEKITEEYISGAKDEIISKIKEIRNSKRISETYHNQDLSNAADEMLNNDMQNISSETFRQILDSNNCSNVETLMYAFDKRQTLQEILELLDSMRDRNAENDEGMDWNFLYDEQYPNVGIGLAYNESTSSLDWLIIAYATNQ